MQSLQLGFFYLNRFLKVKAKRRKEGKRQKKEGEERKRGKGEKMQRDRDGLKKGEKKEQWTKKKQGK